MSNTFITPNMSLVIPIVDQDPGPDYANSVNASLTIVDQHSHVPGSGVFITPAAININVDLTFNSNNATALRSARFTPQLTQLSLPTDIGCLYETGVDLYYNDGNGNQIRITQSGSVAGSAGTITGLPSGTASASYQSASGTFQFQQATATGANIDVASVIIRYPGSYPTPSGNAIILEAPASLSSLYALTLPSLPVANNTFLTINTAGNIGSSVVVDNSTLKIITNTLEVPTGGITTTQIAINTILITNISPITSGGTTASIGQIATTPTSGIFGFSSPTFASVTNMSLTITTNGGPVFIGFQPDSNPTSFSDISTTSARYQIVRGSTVISYTNFNSSAAGSTSPSVLNFTDISIIGAPGTYTYFLQAASPSSTASQIINVVMIGYEIT